MPTRHRKEDRRLWFTASQNVVRDPVPDTIAAGLAFRLCPGPERIINEDEVGIDRGNPSSGTNRPRSTTGRGFPLPGGVPVTAHRHPTLTGESANAATDEVGLLLVVGAGENPAPGVALQPIRAVADRVVLRLPVTDGDLKEDPTDHPSRDPIQCALHHQEVLGIPAELGTSYRKPVPEARGHQLPLRNSEAELAGINQPGPTNQPFSLVAQRQHGSGLPVVEWPCPSRRRAAPRLHQHPASSASR